MAEYLNDARALSIALAAAPAAVMTATMLAATDNGPAIIAVYERIFRILNCHAHETQNGEISKSELDRTMK